MNRVATHVIKIVEEQLKKKGVSLENVAAEHMNF